MLSHQLPPETQLTILYTVEPGCLGPQGDQLIDQFCKFIAEKLNSTFGENCLWIIQYKTHLSAHHIDYQIDNKRLNREQAKQFLHASQKDIEHFENDVDELVVEYIEEFLGRSSSGTS